MIQNIYFKIACALIILFMVCCFIEKKVNKYSYEKGTAINKVKIPDIIQESVPIVRNLDVISDLFISFVMFIFYIIFIDFLFFNKKEVAFVGRRKTNY